MEDIQIIVTSSLNETTGKYDLKIEVPQDKVALNYNEILSLLVGGVSLMIKMVNQLDTDTKDYEVLKDVISKLESDFISTTNYSNPSFLADKNVMSADAKCASNVLLVNEDGYVLGVSRKDNHEDFGLIGGKMEDIDNNNPTNTAIREALEETGLTISDLELVFYKVIDDVHNFTFLAKYSGDISYSENHIVKWVPFNELFRGSFGEYNKELYNRLLSMGYNNFYITEE